MRPTIIYTDNELRRVIPEWDEKLLNTSKGDCKAVLWSLGCDVRSFGIEVQVGLTTRNRFGEIDTSKRYVMYERVDTQWKQSGYASHEACLYDEDDNLVEILGRMGKR